MANEPHRPSISARFDLDRRLQEETRGCAPGFSTTTSKPKIESVSIGWVMAAGGIVPAGGVELLSILQGLLVVEAAVERQWLC